LAAFFCFDLQRTEQSGGDSAGDQPQARCHCVAVTPQAMTVFR
jgi:hypothetical protein